MQPVQRFVIQRDTKSRPIGHSNATIRDGQLAANDDLIFLPRIVSVQSIPNLGEGGTEVHHGGERNSGV